MKNSTLSQTDTRIDRKTDRVTSWAPIWAKNTLKINYNYKPAELSTPSLEHVIITKHPAASMHCTHSSYQPENIVEYLMITMQKNILLYRESSFLNTQVFFRGLEKTVAGFFLECSFNFFIIIVFAFFLDCWISFSRPDKLNVFPDIFERRFVAIRSKITLFLSWNKIWI